MIEHNEAFPFLEARAGVGAKMCLTDPPYLIGAISAGDKGSKGGQWADLLNASFWYSHWLRLAWATLAEDGFLFVFTNWRTSPVLFKAASDAGLQVTNKVIWDKCWIGPGSPRQFRGTYEEIFVMAKPDAVIENRSTSDIFRCKWSATNCKTTDHPAEKPVELIEAILGACCKTGDLVLDPFAGSGTTGVACQRLGLRFEGCDSNQKWAELAAARLSS